MTEISEVKILRPDFTDSRGNITDIFVNNPKDHCCIITTRSNSVRGNHYHKISTQYTYIIDGQLRFARVNIDKNGLYDKSNIIITTVGQGSLITHLPYEAHAFQSIGNSTILAFACGMRGGDNYENDVYRLNNPLFD